MAKKEVKTDLFVYNLLKNADIELEQQGSSIKEIDEALKTASKNGSGNVGFPDYVGVIKAQGGVRLFISYRGQSRFN